MDVSRKPNMALIVASALLSSALSINCKFTPYVVSESGEAHRCLGDLKAIWPVKKHQCHISSKVHFWNKWRTNWQTRLIWGTTVNTSPGNASKHTTVFTDHEGVLRNSSKYTSFLLVVRTTVS